MSNLWLSNATHRVFGWKELLEEWNSTKQLPVQAKRVYDNLKAAIEPNGTHDPSLTQFLTYLNYEQEGIAWFLYECISTRWMYDTIPLNYIRNLVDEIEDLDAHFPVFPGSPYTQTIRQFVEANLYQDELDQVQMLPPLVSQHYEAPNTQSYEAPNAPSYETTNAQSYETPTRPVRAEYSYAQRAPFAPLRRTPPVSQTRVPRVRRSVPQAPEAPQVPQASRTLSQQFEELSAPKDLKQAMQVRFIRSKKGSNDDIVNIIQNSADSYNIIYQDKQASVKTKTLAVPRAAVMSFLSMTLRMLTVDEEPFESIQFTLPSLPTILVSPKNLSSQTRDLIYDSVEATMNFWPVYA